MDLYNQEEEIREIKQSRAMHTIEEEETQSVTNVSIQRRESVPTVPARVGILSARRKKQLEKRRYAYAVELSKPIEVESIDVELREPFDGISWRTWLGSKLTHQIL